tara:strand:- start:176 stop:382 length:207 start_codon:yes stop_codon:yes gene_type:complete
MKPQSRVDIVAYDLIAQRLDRIEKNHLKHIESRLNKLETNQWWLMAIGLSTLGSLFAAVIGILVTNNV